MKGLSILTYTYDHILRAENEEGLDKEDTKKVTSMLTDAMALFSDTSHSLDIMRRQHFRAEFKEEFSQLCSDKYPVKDKLFGSDTVLHDKVKDVAETLKVSYKVNRHHPYQQQRKKNHFLGRQAPLHQHKNS